MTRRSYVCLIASILLSSNPAAAQASEWFVVPGGVGSGTSASPFGQVQDALNVAQPGDLINLAAGVYAGTITTVRHGTSGAPITLRAAGAPRSAMITSLRRVLTVSHSFFKVDGLILDGQYGLDDAVRVGNSGHSFHLRNTEVRRSTKDLIDIGAANGVLIDHCLIHHALNAAGGRTDAHGIVAGPVQDLTIRDTEIHTFSGDGVQVDAGRSAPGWNRVTIERARIWLAPLPSPENGFPAGAVPGENAVDTKASPSYPRATIVIRDTVASGFRESAPMNWAAFNLKEHIDATVERVTVSDSEIAFRLRGAVTGGAWVNIKNAVVYNVLTAFRYEDNIDNLRIWNSTIGRGVTRVFQAASSVSTGLEVLNVLVLGALPAEANGPSNLAVSVDAFANAIAHDYAPSPGAPQIDSGVTIAGVTTDRLGVQRPQGVAYDVGAHEWDDGVAANTPPAITLTTPVEGATFVAPGTISIVAAVSDADGSVTEVRFSANGALIDRDTTSPYAVTLNNLGAGRYTLEATVVDNLGAMTSTSVHVTVTVANNITLSARGFKVKGLQKADLTWTPTGSGSVTVYRNGQLLTTTPHDGAYPDNLNRKGGGTYIYKVCTATSTPLCTNEATIVF